MEKEDQTLTENHASSARAGQGASPKLVPIYAYASDIQRLLGHGYTEVDEAPSRPGQFRVLGSDVAPGWDQYWYDLDVYELPDQPLRSLGWNC